MPSRRTPRKVLCGRTNLARSGGGGSGGAHGGVSSPHRVRSPPVTDGAYPESSSMNPSVHPTRRIVQNRMHKANSKRRRKKKVSSASKGINMVVRTGTSERKYRSSPRSARLSSPRNQAFEQGEQWRERQTGSDSDDVHFGKPGIQKALQFGGVHREGKQQQQPRPPETYAGPNDFADANRSRKAYTDRDYDLAVLERPWTVAYHKPVKGPRSPRRTMGGVVAAAVGQRKAANAFKAHLVIDKLKAEYRRQGKALRAFLNNANPEHPRQNKMNAIAELLPCLGVEATQKNIHRFMKESGPGGRLENLQDEALERARDVDAFREWSLAQDQSFSAEELGKLAEHKDTHIDFQKLRAAARSAFAEQRLVQRKRAELAHERVVKQRLIAETTPTISQVFRLTGPVQSSYVFDKGPGSPNRMDKPVPDSLTFYGRTKPGAKLEGRFDQEARPQTAEVQTTAIVPGSGRRPDLLTNYGLPSSFQTTKMLEGRWPPTQRRQAAVGDAREDGESEEQQAEDPFVRSGALSPRRSPTSPKSPRSVRGVSPRLRVDRPKVSNKFKRVLANNHEKILSLYRHHIAEEAAKNNTGEAPKAKMRKRRQKASTEKDVAAALSKKTDPQRLPYEQFKNMITRLAEQELGGDIPSEQDAQMMYLTYGANSRGLDFNQMTRELKAQTDDEKVDLLNLSDGLAEGENIGIHTGKLKREPFNVTLAPKSRMHTSTLTKRSRGIKLEDDPLTDKREWRPPTAPAVLSAFVTTIGQPTKHQQRVANRHAQLFSPRRKDGGVAVSGSAWLRKPLSGRK